MSECRVVRFSPNGTQKNHVTNGGNMTNKGIKIILTLGLSVLLANCAKKDGSPESVVGIPTCNEIAKDIKDNNSYIKTEILCTCSVADYTDAASKSPNGVSTYFVQSDLCAAARHMDVLNSSDVTLVDILPGDQCSYFAGSANNGVTSVEKELSGNDHTFYFKGKGNGYCNVKAVDVSCASTTKEWVVSGKTCSGTIEAYAGPNLGSKSVSDSEGSAKGSATFVCENDAWRTNPESGASCSEAADDTTPDAFSFALKDKQAPNVDVISGTVTVAGITVQANISIGSVGSYRINDGSWVTVAGKVKNGDKVQVKHKSSTQFNTEVQSVLTIGGVSGTFKSKTDVKKIVPAQFDFGATKQDVALDSIMTSGTITVTGINTPATIKITGGSYKVNSGAWKTADGTVNNNDKVIVAHRSSASYNTEVKTTLMIGGDGTFKSDDFISKTQKEDVVPAAFSFADKINAVTSATVSSGSAIISGLNSLASISIDYGQYLIKRKDAKGVYQTILSWTSTTYAAKVKANDMVYVRHVAHNLYGERTKTSTLIIGGTEGTFTSKTMAIDTKPDDNFKFDNRTNLTAGSFYAPDYRIKLADGSYTAGSEVTLTGFHINADTDLKITEPTGTVVQYKIKLAGGSYSTNWLNVNPDVAIKVNEGTKIKLQIKITSANQTKDFSFTVGTTANGSLVKNIRMTTRP